jgi:SAM-dependent methyltransferase
MKKFRIEKLFDCPVCGSKKIKYWSKANDLLTKLSNKNFIYSICSECSVLFMSKRPIEKDISFFYTSDYHPYQNKTPYVFKQHYFSKLKKFFSLLRNSVGIHKIINNVYKPCSKRSIFVDFGCGAGKYLDIMRNRNFKTVGVDFSDIAVSSVIQNKHQGFLVKDFFKKFPDESVDLMRMNHVFEHLYQPIEMLYAIRIKLKKDGVLHIAVPNSKGISSRIFFNYWHGLDCPRHIILYPPERLVSILNAHGFDVFHVANESTSKDFIRSLGYVLYQLGFIRHENVNKLMDSKILKTLMFLPFQLLAKLGLGDRYHIFCRKIARATQ